ncbi:hypothetical protein BGX27_007046 [Mortierella sp. AM989]|nr:hypothetical protein BGX27_007046 [Mortierella sp. AM989]
MRFSAIAITATLIGAVLAQVRPSRPRQGDVWILKSKVTIYWAPRAPATLPVQLLSGPTPSTQKVVAELGDAPKGENLLAIEVPNVPVGWYTVRIGDSYSHIFAIQADAKTPPSTPEPKAPNVTTTVSAQPTGSSTASASSSVVLPTSATTANTSATKPPSPSSTLSGAASGYLKSVMPLAATAAAVILTVMTL